MQYVPLLLTPCADSMRQSCADSVLSLPAPPQLLCVGYSERLRHFIVRNSWSTEWGDEGYCYMPFEYLCNGGTTDTCCTQFVALTAVIDPALDMGSLDAELDDDEPLWDEEEEYEFDEGGGEPEWESDSEDDEDDEDIEDEAEDEDEDEDLFDPMQEARDVFEKFDADGSGEIEWRELKEALRCAGSYYSNKQIKRMQKTYDEDGSGSLSFEEFIRVPGVLPEGLADQCFEQMESVENKRSWLAHFEELRDAGVEVDEDGDNVEQWIVDLQAQIEELELQEQGEGEEEDEGAEEDDENE